MGLFSFLKGKGKNLGAANAAEAAPPKEALEKELDDLDLDTAGVELEVDPESSKVKIKGQAKDQETREKVILAVGNVEGVAQVEDETEGPEPRFHTVEAGDSREGLAALWRWRRRRRRRCHGRR